MGADELFLFTGFPGFIGARLLARLLELKAGCGVRCLVEERFLGKAQQEAARIEAEAPHAKGRIGFVAGDIAAPRLGMEAGAGQALQRDLTAAYHLAAVYDLAAGRAVSERINVQGTKNVVEFLREAPRLERLHYVSTAYVCGRAKGVFRETDLDVGQPFRNHYEETKFLAEVEVARSGLPATIYRPGVVVGDSRTGETAKFDGPYFVLNALVKLPSPGLFIRMGSGRSPINVVPVDFVVEALARLSTLPLSRGKTYHLTDPDPLSAFEVQECFARALGKSFLYLPLPVSLVKRLLSLGPIQDYFGIPPQAVEYFEGTCRHDATQAAADLAPLGVECPRLPEYAPRLVKFFLAQRARQSAGGTQARP